MFQPFGSDRVWQLTPKIGFIGQIIFPFGWHGIGFSASDEQGRFGIGWWSFGSDQTDYGPLEIVRSRRSGLESRAEPKPRPPQIRS
jgi:hypothetical protein